MEVLLSNVPKLRFPEFSDEWRKEALQELAKISSGGTPSRARPEFWGGDIPWVTTAMVDYHEIYEVDEYITKDGLSGSSAKYLPPGTVLMAMIGQGKTRGKVGVLAISATTNQNCAAINPIRLDNYFVYFYLTGQYENLRKLSNEGGQQSLSLGLIKSIVVPFPSLLEQQKIAAFLTAVDTKIEQLTQKEALLKQYKKGVMQKIFSQEIRFKADDGSVFPEWEERKVSALCEVRKGTQLNKENLTEYGDYPALNGGVSPSGYTENWNTESDTITISEGGNSCGFVNFVRTRFWSGGHNYSLQKLSPNCSKYYLFQFLKFNEPQIMRLRVGSGLPNIQKSDLNEFAVLTPCLAEQSKIASYLGVLDIKIDQLTSQLDSAKTFKKGLLQQMFV